MQIAMAPASGQVAAARFVSLVAITLFILTAVGLMTASDASADFQPPLAGACAAVPPPTGQTGGEYWVNGETGDCDGGWISDEQFQSVVNREVAIDDYATGTEIPDDIPSTDVEAGKGVWDSLRGASQDFKTTALEFLERSGVWESFGTLGAAAGIAVAGSCIANELGWKLGGSIANLLGICASDKHNDGEFCGSDGVCSGTNYTASGTMAMSAGFDLNPTLGGSCWSQNHPQDCVDVHATLPSDSFIVTFSLPAPGGATYGGYEANNQCPGDNDPNGIPADAVRYQVSHWSAQCGLRYPAVETEASYVWAVPAKVTALPGPGQGGTSQANTVEGTPLTPSESQLRDNVTGMLQDPSGDPMTEAVCNGPDSPCPAVPPPYTVAIPTPSAGESWNDYQTDLANAGITNVERQIAPSSTADLDEPASAVTVVSPAPGTAVYTLGGTVVTVTTNPDASDMPEPTAREIQLASTLQDQNDGVTDRNKLDLARSCLELVDAATGNTDTSGGSGDVSSTKCSTLPIFVSGYDVREAAQHDLEALGWTTSPNNADQTVNPAWVQLTKDVTGKTNDRWYVGQAPCTSPTPNLMNCDEYPFFSSTQGGPGANLKYINGDQNQLQGTRLRQFYSAATPTSIGLDGCNIPPSQAFLAIPLPSNLDINTFWACNTWQTANSG